MATPNTNIHKIIAGNNLKGAFRIENANAVAYYIYKILRWKCLINFDYLYN